MTITKCKRSINMINYRHLFIFSLKDLESLLQRNKSLVEESENLTEALAKQREKYEQLQVSYCDHSYCDSILQ